MKPNSIQVVDHATCLGCGCLCDDIRVTVEAGRIIEARNACESIGIPWFTADRPGEGHPAATIDGAPASFEQAVDRAVAILGSSRAPIVLGLNGVSIEAVREALAIADRLGAVVDPGLSPSDTARLRAFPRVGQVSATLGEIKSRADVVVFWGVDPLTTHPRFWERTLGAPDGRFLGPGSRRSVIVIDHQPTPTALASDYCLHVDSDRQGETLWALRGLIRGVELDTERVEASTGVPFSALEDLATRLKQARYGALFFGDSLATSWAFEGALTLVRDLNQGRRFVAMTLGSAGNAAGVEAILTWQAGAPSSLDYGSGFPRYLPGDATMADRSRQGEVDAVLMIGEGETGEVSTIRIAPGATKAGSASSVAFDVARTGIESGGTVSRADGVMLPLRASLSVGLPSDREVLAAIGRRLERSTAR